MPDIDIVRSDNDPRQSDHGIRADTASRGVDLEGAKITVTYTDGTTETLTWKALDPYTAGGATGDNIDMYFGYDWHQLTTTKPLASLKIDLAPANSVFDTTFASDGNPNDPSTPGSKEGFPFKVSPDYEDLGGTITATYSGIAGLDGNAPVGDLYTTMTLDFTSLPGGGLQGDLVWNSDIDTLTGPFASSVTATDDFVSISGNGSEVIDILGNDAGAGKGPLTISHIAGTAISAGESVTLASGEVITLNPDGTLSITNDSPEDETNSFTYTVVDEAGNTATGTVTVDTKLTAPPCFVAGTLIDTEAGPIAVEDLTVGMQVMTRDHGPQPLRWIGRSTRLARGRNAPVLIARNALGHHGQIALSPNHRVLIRSELADLQFGQPEVLIKAKHLVNGDSIRILSDGTQVCYVHILFDRHEIVRANGLDSESYHPGAETLDAFDADTRAEILDLMSDWQEYGPAARITLKPRECALLQLNRH